MKNIGIVHDKFQSEREIVNNNEVQKTVDKLIKKKFVYKGKIKPPEGEDKNNWVEREQLLFKSTDFAWNFDKVTSKLSSIVLSVGLGIEKLDKIPKPMTCMQKIFYY